MEVKMTDMPEVTGRDDYLVALALYEFVRSEQAKSKADRREMDEEDAKAILHARYDNELRALAQTDREAGREPPDCTRTRSIGG
jgi:hypothetical protein